MRQTTLFGLPGPLTLGGGRRAVVPHKETRHSVSFLQIADGTQSLVDFLCGEEDLVFHAVLPLGNTLKCIAELLLRCAPQSPMCVDADNGLTFTACDPSSGRLIHIRIHPDDMIQFRMHSVQKAPFRCSLETTSLFASFHPGGGPGLERRKAYPLSTLLLFFADHKPSLQKKENKMSEPETAVRMADLHYLKDPTHVFPERWRTVGPFPGDPGFTGFIHDLLNKARLRNHLTCDFKSPIRLWQQNVLAFLVHPHSPIERLLVVWQLGTGKTYGMIRVLDNFFDDPRPKVLVFPTSSLVANFYRELLRLPNRYGDWLRKERGITIPRHADARTVAETVHRAQEELERHPMYTKLAAPLRAFSYSRAGGRTLETWSGLRFPKGVKRPMGSNYVLSNCIVLCDEVHNITHPRAKNTDIAHLIAACGKRVWYAKHSVVVLFSATPVLDGESDAHDILRLTKGAFLTGRGDEGFVSWFMDRPAAMFATVDPDPASLPKIVRVPIDVSLATQKPTTLFKHYRQKRFGPYPPVKSSRCLTGRDPKCAPTWASYESLAYYWHHESKHLDSLHDLAHAHEVCPKLAAIAESIAKDGRKTLVLIHHENGYRTLLHVLHLLQVSVQSVRSLRGLVGAELKRAQSENTATLETFNDGQDNLRGERVRVMVVPAAEYSEGVSFLNVRRLILADLSPGLDPPRWAHVKQRVGRALRACSHHSLPRVERTLQVELFVSVHHQPDLPPTIDEEKLEALERDMVAVEKGMDYLRRQSVDAEYYRTYHPPETDRLEESAWAHGVMMRSDVDRKEGKCRVM